MPQARVPLLLTRLQAAAFLNMSPRHFDRLKHDIPAVVVGTRKRLYTEGDLIAWAEQRKHPGSSPGAKTRAPTKSSSVTPAAASVSPQAATILARLQRKLHASTPRS
jgi:hypothetical protein